MSVSITGTTPLPSATPLSGAATAAGAHRGAPKAGGASDQDQSSQQISNQITATNPDGSTTTTITYADGTTATTTQPAAPGQANAKSNANQPVRGGQQAVGGLLDPNNVGQNAALLAAQEKAKVPA
jgi:hypothetical protein